jgi:hypothetical protein
MGRVGSGKEPVIPKKFLLPVVADLETQRELALLLPKAREHLLACTKGRMPPSLDLACLRQLQADRTDVFQGHVVATGGHCEFSL